MGTDWSFRSRVVAFCFERLIVSRRPGAAEDSLDSEGREAVQHDRDVHVAIGNEGHAVKLNGEKLPGSDRLEHVEIVGPWLIDS